MCAMGEGRGGGGGGRELTEQVWRLSNMRLLFLVKNYSRLLVLAVIDA